MALTYGGQRPSTIIYNNVNVKEIYYKDQLVWGEGTTSVRYNVEGSTSAAQLWLKTGPNNGGSYAAATITLSIPDLPTNAVISKATLQFKQGNTGAGGQLSYYRIFVGTSTSDPRVYYSSTSDGFVDNEDNPLSAHSFRSADITQYVQKSSAITLTFDCGAKNELVMNLVFQPIQVLIDYYI